MAEKKSMGKPTVKSVTLSDIKAAEAKAGGVTVSASKTGDDDKTAKDLDRHAKDLDRREKTTSTKDLDKDAKQVDKTAKDQDQNDKRNPYDP
jgi:hypothetical protein